VRVVHDASLVRYRPLSQARGDGGEVWTVSHDVPARLAAARAPQGAGRASETSRKATRVLRTAISGSTPLATQQLMLHNASRIVLRRKDPIGNALVGPGDRGDYEQIRAGQAQD